MVVMVSVETPSLFPPADGGVPLGSGGEVTRDLAGLGMHPAVATWFERRFPEGPTSAQRQGWAQIAQGRDTLIAAPTGSGKTLAGFLVGIDRLYRAHARGEAVADRAQVVYVSPLKALAVDIAENLERPLREIAEVAAELGLDAPDLRVGVRTGDTTSTERAAMVRRPPNFVITTPESLYLLVTAARSRTMLATVDTIIVDEIHAVARDKRGSHLALTLERVEFACGSRPQRVGLSATQRPISLVADLLTGTGAPEPCAIVDTGHQRRLDLALELPQGELEAVASAEQMGDVIDRIAALVQEHHTTIVFVNTRRLAERLAHQLGEKLGDDVVAAHHGSLSKDRRYKVESRLRGRRPAGAGGDRLARTGHRRRPGRAGVPARLAPQHRDVPPAGGSGQPQPPGRTQGAAVPAHARRAGRERRAARGGGQGSARRRDPARGPARHPRPADRGRGGRRRAHQPQEPARAAGGRRRRPRRPRRAGRRPVRPRHRRRRCRRHRSGRRPCPRRHRR